MTETPAAVATDTPPEAPAPRKMGFRKSTYNQVKLSRPEAQRQGDITQMAFLQLGGRDAALAFLNTADDKLGGRPLDIAIADADGFATIEQAIRKLAGKDAK